jgi:DNA-binding HxlR family transcriptional regulator
MHFHGTEIMRPVPFYRIFKGALFSQVEEAANFVLSVTNVSVGTRALGPQAPVRLEIPRDVIQEAIVNALVHRDYTSSAAVQVSVFADRVEIWNPGELLPPLTPDSLRVPHRSITRNHRICESMFLAGYIEKYGTGTLMMIRESVEHALPEPMFKQCGGEFVAIVGRDWLTEEVLSGLNLSDRQVRGVMHVKLHGRITNSTYRQLVGVSERTALRDLRSLANMGLLEKTEGTGRIAQYELAKAKPVINPPNPSAPPADETRHKPAKPATKGDINGTSEGASAEPVSHVSKHQVERNALRDTDIHDKRARQKTAQVGTKSAPSRHQVEAHDEAYEAHVVRQAPDKYPTSTRQVLTGLVSAGSGLSRTELQAAAQFHDREHFVNEHLNPMLAAGLVEMTIPDKPRSPNQKYRLTDKGRQWLEDSHA